MTPHSAAARAPSKSTLAVRVSYPLEPMRIRYEVFVPIDDHSQPHTAPLSFSATTILDALNHVLSTNYDPFVYDEHRQRFVSLRQLAATQVLASHDPHDDQSSLFPCVHVKLIERTTSTTPPSHLAERLSCDSGNTSLNGSWFGIGIIRGKTASNHGSLWRSALQLGASLTFTIGKRYDKKVEGSADIYKTHRQIPCISYNDVASFKHNAPLDAQIVVIEYGGASLVDFKHPKRALYVLGSEDNGVPPAFVKSAHCHVSVPTAEGRPSSLNVAAAGAIVLYDRYAKLSLKDTQSAQVGT
ncbi:unnamed protein product [Agarophyton chilense]|eukprot:gb/GEZJ01000555.1/.p2 GENE.gb/GEZJ01000555.1/~~gb/GEZJ01000555.1/.p2  ORF type:complete len:299 (+),score=37.17 gb/GEZJ01000555.1/:485-1381(+)